MVARPYSDKTFLSTDSSNSTITRVPSQTLPETSSSSTHSETTSPVPALQEQVLIEPLIDTVVIQEINRIPDLEAAMPYYPTPGDIVPYDHSLPEFIRQITNQPNLAELHSLRLKVISTLVSLHRMSLYLPNLIELDLEGSILNSLRDIGCNFKNLQILKVGHCQLESLDGTFGLSSLRELYAQKNFINDVSPCSNLPHICHIDVSSNRIRNISYAGFLSVCTKLKSIIFTGNPATEVSDYRKHVRRILPQIESLDGILFINEGNNNALLDEFLCEEAIKLMRETKDNTEKFKDPEQIENMCEESDCSSTEVPDFLSVSPSDSMNNFFESEEDIFHLDKKNKQAKNLGNQDQIDNVDFEIQEFSPGIKTNLELQDVFQNLNSYQNKVKKGLLEQAKIIENRVENINQKCASIQKLDKDVENRSKKSNLLINVNLNEELILSSNFSKYPALKESNTCSPSASATTANTDELRKTGWMEKKSTSPCTASESTHYDAKTEKMKLGAIKKRSSSEIPNPMIEEHKREPSILTTGLPICGNLTAALRTRKKIQSACGEKQDYLSQRFKALSGLETKEGKQLEIQINGSGDFDTAISDFDMAKEDELVEKDVLVVSKKWREAFRRFRSINRARWEEEEELDCTDLLREISDSNDERIKEKTHASAE